MVWDIILNATDYLRMIQQTSFELRFQKWKGRQEWRVVVEENCFEGDKYN
jgi:N-acyl-L-homoserine lactone synthetase